MEKTNYAAIDIGSNAVRLLIKSVDMEEGTASFVKEQLLRVPLRLGEDTFSVGTISKEKGKRLLRLMKSLPQTTHLAVFFGFVSKIYNSLSSGRTSVLNHLQIICE